MIIPNIYIYGKIKFMFQTTNQLFHSLVDIIIVRRPSIGHKHDKPRVVMLMSFFLEPIVTSATWVLLGVLFWVLTNRKGTHIVDVFFLKT
jgi:hypothetical protein